MDKMRLRNGTEIQIYDGASLSLIVTKIDSYTDLYSLILQLTPGNLTDVQFINELNETISEYTDMALTNDQLMVSVGKDPITVTFGIRERTSEEKKHDDIITAITYLSDEQAVTVKELYPIWAIANNYKINDRVQYEDKLYKCLQDHQSQSDWSPDVSPSLWAEILTKPGEILPWKQPSSTNGYKKGDKVIHNEKTWESDIDNNVWEPGVVGTESLWHII